MKEFESEREMCRLVIIEREMCRLVITESGLVLRMVRNGYVEKN
jgi:hypothetical protein